ncbi:DUF1775 domain-containing protein [Streptomyces sp. SID3212]|uniref:DUF1775 domain-containing protein n=1 Tax=Streptomyces sp. SID3212 TaxID=2690259 RepID=UPI0031F5F539
MRAAVFTLISVVLAAVGHHLASEEPVPWARLAVMAVVVGTVAAAGTGRARSWGTVTVATCAAQFVLHTALSASAASVHDHARAHTRAGARLGLGYEAHYGPMTLAHGTAAVAVALLMYRADRALSGLPRTVGRWARTGIALVAAAWGRWPAPARVTTSVRRHPRDAAVRPATETMLSHVVERRGPPSGRAGEALPLILAGRPYAGRVRPYRESPIFVNTSSTGRVLRRYAVAVAAAAAVVAAGAGPAAAHAEVSASDARALAENVTLSFTSEAESDDAGIKTLRVVLPEGIAPDAVALKDAPKGWKLTATADGYTVGGAALGVGTDAEHSVTVRQLPDAESLVFKTVETYGNGEISRWIEVPSGGKKVENPAPVLELKPAAPGAKPLSPSPSPSPTPEPSVTSSSPAPAPSTPAAASTAPAEAAVANDSGRDTTVIIAVVAVVVVLVAGAGVWWSRRSRNQV